ncbi:Endonuclease/exonuclease/phosphatase [Cercophora newfieldiana]|uniref:DNA-(apurinic or apyrimidinic site) endonuclease 2 n=1 Tax=Cercophora newfieldiana TaxID=92897 RepID=A0AA39YQE7_9PEZI|nr:Endonuclease/exonuclease/phosphatase [Cercophora newfieldiana]
MPLPVCNDSRPPLRNPFSYQPWREDRTYQAMFDKLEADIVVMQETKIQRKDLHDDMVLVPGWDVHFSLPKHKKGYSGVAIYTRSSKCCPIRAEEGITGVLCPPNSSTKFRDLPPDQQIGGYPRPGQLSSALDEPTLDSEGRCVVLEFPAFVLIGVYTPATRDETRTEFRQGWIDALDIRVRNLVAMGKQVVLCGDLNIIRSELDTAGLAEQLRREAMTLDDFYSRPARRFLNQFVFGGRVVGERDEGREEPVVWDICREFHPSRTGMYTCWETRKNARPGNFGSRIDYVLCSSGIKDWFVDANIQEGLLGSDHCPVYATLGDAVSRDGAAANLVDMMNPEGMFRDGQRVRAWTTKDLLPTSAKLIPEFDKRRSIRDMFQKSATRDASDPASEPPPSSQPRPSPRTSSSQPRPSSSQPRPSSSQPPTSSPRPSSNPFATPPKRQAAALTTSRRPPKKTRKEKPTKASSGPAQRSLMGFFKPQSSEAGPNKEIGDATIESTPTQSDAPSADEWARPQPAEPTDPVETPDLKSGPSGGLLDPVESKASWSKLLGKRTVPRCAHDEDCHMLTTKKAGVNCGRSFFACSRPLGPSGRNEEGTEFRCGTFIWSSDWNGR